MKLLFKQRAFTWFDSYDIYDENENTVYVVKGQLSWGHCLKIFDASEEHELGTVKEQIFSWWPQFELTDTYVLDIADPEDALYVLMFVLAIDAEKCSRN